MLSLLLFSVLTDAARLRCVPNLLGPKLRRIKVADDAEVERQRASVTLFARALPRTLKKHLPGFAQAGFARVVEVEADDQPADLHPGWGPRNAANEFEAWLTLPGRLVKETAVGAKPTPFADEILKFAERQDLRAVLYHWVQKEVFDGVAYGQWYDVTTRVTKPTIPPETFGRARPEFAGGTRRREPDERYFSLGKGQPETYVRIGWK